MISSPLLSSILFSLSLSFLLSSFLFPSLSCSPLFFFPLFPALLFSLSLSFLLSSILFPSLLYSFLSLFFSLSLSSLLFSSFLFSSVTLTSQWKQISTLSPSPPLLLYLRLACSLSKLQKKSKQKIKYNLRKKIKY